MNETYKSNTFTTIEFTFLYLKIQQIGFEEIGRFSFYEMVGHERIYPPISFHLTIWRPQTLTDKIDFLFSVTATKASRLRNHQTPVSF